MDERSKPRKDIPKIDSSAKVDAARSLRSAETGASSDAPKNPEDNLDGARSNEANGFYTGAGRDLSVLPAKGKLSGKKKLKGKGPIGFIIALILGTGGLMAGAQLFQPFSLVEQFREAFNSMQVTANKRSDTFFKMQMGSGKYQNPIKGTLFRGDTFKITPKQQARLAKQGIEVDNVQGHTVLRFDDGTGSMRIVTADEATARSIGGDAISFKNLYETNSDFFHGYNQGSMTWRGAISNWFGQITVRFLNKNKITRNLFKDYIEKVQAAEDGNTRKVALDIMAKGTDDVREGGVEVRRTDEVIDETEVDDGEGRHHTETSWRDDDKVHDSGSTTRRGSDTFDRTSIHSEDDVRQKLNDIADDYSGGTFSVGNLQKVANYSCLVVNFIGGVSLLVTAAEALKIISLVTSFLETVDKTKAGLGEAAPMNELAQTLNETKKNEHVLYGETDTGGSLDRETTAMQAEGMAAIYERRSANPKDRSVQSFNVSGSIKRIFGGIGVSMAAFETCSLAKLVLNAVSAVQAVGEIAACLGSLIAAFFTFGASLVGCAGLVTDFLVGVAASAAMAVLISSAIEFLTPIVTKILTRDLISNIGGEDLGNALVSGANMYLGNTHRANGGSLANEQKYTEFALAQQEVIAENARYERMSRSPFDLTSKYTFLGTLMTQMMTFLSANSLMSTVTASSTVVSNSIIALSPTARAFEVSAMLPNWDEYEETCPYLYSIGAVGDEFCNPYSITDMSTMEKDPGEIVNNVDSFNPFPMDSKRGAHNNFLDETRNDNGVEVPVINQNSDLAKYILYCDNRTSAFGIADQNIVSGVTKIGNAETGSKLGDTLANAAIGAVPVVGDMIDVLQNAEAIANSGYVSGQTCVAGNKTPSPVTPDWEYAKNYQRFIEDQSLSESMGLVEKGAVTAFLDEYYEQNPVDNSYEGILARYSGLTKENVIALLDIMDYSTYIANYDPNTRYQFTQPVVEKPDTIFFESENIIAENPMVILLNQISFADVRNRSFVV